MENICAKFNATGTVSNRKRNGRPPTLLNRDARRVKLFVLRNRGENLERITGFANTLPNIHFISLSAVRCFLCNLHFYRRVAVKNTFTNNRNRHQRVLWTRQSLLWECKSGEGYSGAIKLP